MRSFSIKSLILLPILLLISACGFKPIYDSTGSGIGKLEVAPIEGRTGYFLQTNLSRRSKLETGDSRKLEIKLTRNFTNSSLRADGYTTRVQINYTADYVLANKPNDIKGSVNSLVSFDGRNSAYSEISLMQDAEESAANDLADRIWLDILTRIKQNSAR